MNGEVGVLNVGAGDTKLSFDKSNPAERIRAARIVTDMLRRGYALLVEVEPGQYQRAKAFDEDKCEYIVADFDPVVASECSCPPDGVSASCRLHGDATHRAEGQERVETSGTQETREEATAGKATGAKRSRGRPRTKRVDAGSTRSIAVGRTAGG